MFNKNMFPSQPIAHSKRSSMFMPCYKYKNRILPFLPFSDIHGARFAKINKHTEL